MPRFALALLLYCLPVLVCAGPSVVDTVGRTVSLEQPAQRIVALAPHIVENLFSAGAGDKLVAVVSYSDYPEPARSLPQVGSAFSWSLESVVALAPDLVVMWGSGNGMSALPKLERLGLNVYVSEPRAFADISDSIRDFGALAGTTETASRTAQDLDDAIARLRNRNRSNAPPLSVFYQIWNAPLQTVNGEHLISEVIALCGGYNIYSTQPLLTPHISLESLLATDPQVIVASGMGESRPEWLDDWRRYPSLQAVQHNTLLHVHPDLIQRPTARIVLGARSLCTQLEEARRAYPRP
jgi:iron complex transport system substrate-binding protein